MADVQVEFGAKIDQLISGVEETRKAIESLKAASEKAAEESKRAFEKMKESIDKVREGAKSLLEVLGIAISLEGIKSYIEHMGELGLQTELTMAMLGVSAESVITLGGAARLTGTSMDGLATSMERLTLNVQMSQRDAFNPAAQGLAVLGLRAKDLVGIPADKQFEKLAEAISKFKPSMELTNAVMAVGGRGIAQMIPLLSQGGEHWAHMKEEVEHAREGLAKAAPGMAQTHEKLTLMAMSAESFGARIFTVLKPAIDAAVVSVTKWLQSMDQQKVADFVLITGGIVIQVGEQIALFAINAKEKYDLFMNTIGGSLPVLYAAAAAAAMLAGQFKASAEFALKAALTMAAGSKVSNASIAADAEKSRAAVKKLTDEWMEGLANVAAAAKLKTETVDEGEKKTAAAIAANARQQMEATLKGIDAQISILKTGYETKKILIEQEADTHRITQDKKFAQLQAELSKEIEAERAALQRKLAVIPAAEIAMRAEVNAKLLELDARAGKDRAALDKESIASMQRNWSEGLNMIGSAFNSQLRGLLTGTVTWSQAMKNIMLDLVIKGIEWIEKYALEWAAGQLATVTATTTANQAKVASAAAAAAEGAAIKKAALFETITADSGQTFAGLSAFYAPMLGPAAPAAATAETTAITTTAMGMAALDTGAWEIPRAGVAMLHPGETVLPAGAAEAFRAMAAGKTVGPEQAVAATQPIVNVHVQAWDGASVHSFLKGGGGELIARHVAAAMNKNPTLRPAF